VSQIELDQFEQFRERIAETLERQSAPIGVGGLAGARIYIDAVNDCAALVRSMRIPSGDKHD